MLKTALLILAIWLAVQFFFRGPLVAVTPPVLVVPLDSHSDCCLVPANRGLYDVGSGVGLR